MVKKVVKGGIHCGVVLTALIGLYLLLFPPTLSLHGDKSTTMGAVFHVYGKGFIPWDHVVLTLDHTEASAESSLPPLEATLTPQPTNLVQDALPALFSADGSGNLALQFAIDRQWTPGHHMLYATETGTERSTGFSFTLLQQCSDPCI